MSERLTRALESTGPIEHYGVEVVNLFDEAQRIFQACEETGVDAREMASSYATLARNMQIILEVREHKSNEK